MKITKVFSDQILSSCRRTLGLSENPEELIDDILLAALLRRSGGIHGPCSRVTLRASLLESLQHLSTDAKELSDRLDEIIEGLIVGGDLLELSDVVIGDFAAKGTWVFAAPPSFVKRPSGSIFLFGIVPDQDTFLPRSLASRICYEGLVRTIKPESGENLSDELREQGLQQLSTDTWLKSPKEIPPEEMFKKLNDQLELQPPSGTIDGLQILDATRPVNYYRGRWVASQSQTGTFVARRQQEFGAPLWCLVALKDGAATRLLDLPGKETQWRGCDVAWHLQMAIDRCRNSPQCYRRSEDGNNVRIDFFSPLPKWAERRLMVFGRSVPPRHSLKSYQLPIAEAKIEEDFLQKRLWLSCEHGSG